MQYAPCEAVVSERRGFDGEKTPLTRNAAQGGHAQGEIPYSPKAKSAATFLLQRFAILGWLMGLEPTTTGITILDSTN